jgi:sugar phosphate isomerase/epimerase
VEINLLSGGDLVYRSRDLLDAARARGLRYLVHAPNEGKPTEVERLGSEFFREILRLLDACVEIHAPLLTAHFWMDGRFIPPEVAERKRAILWDMARAAAARGVQFCLENLSERPEDLEAALAGCPVLGLTLDIGHGQLLTDANRALDFVSRWPKRILHVHVHDNRGGHLVGDDLHLPIGEGVIDFETVFRALVRAGYGGTVTLEVPLEHLPASLERLRTILESLSGQKTSREVLP